MHLDPVELRRLAIIQRTPTAYVERRVEHLELVDDYHYAAKVTQQLTIPPVPGEEQNLGPRSHWWYRAAKVESEATPVRLVPLGFFGKERLPDIQVGDDSGRALPVITREDQGRVAAYLFSDGWKDKAFKSVPAESHAAAAPLWVVVETAVERTVSSAPAGAYIVIYRLRRFLEVQVEKASMADDVKGFVRDLVANDEFWASLGRLARSRLLVVCMHATLDETYVITSRYTERFNYDVLRPTKFLGKVARGIQWLLRWLGLAGLLVGREASNIGQAASLWVIFTAPDGLEPVRCFWRSKAREPAYEEISVDISRAAVGNHVTSPQDTRLDATILDLQVDPSPAVATTILLASVLFVIGFYMYKESLHIAGLAPEERSLLVALATLFAGIPTGVIGALAYRNNSIVRKANNGPRFLLVLLTVLATALTLAIGLHQPRALTEDLGFSLMIFSFVIFGVFVGIRFAPRWRRNERSRRPRKTRATSPWRCRLNQISFAFVALVVWLRCTWIVGKAAVLLHRQHIFGQGNFPKVVWHALRAASGL
jgi:hypothetical protein